MSTSVWAMVHGKGLVGPSGPHPAGDRKGALGWDLVGGEAGGRVGSGEGPGTLPAMLDLRPCLKSGRAPPFHWTCVSVEC